MRYSEMSIEEEYKIPRDNITEKFYIPVISNSISYQRAVGYFSSSSLIKFSRGLTGLINNGGTVQLITSPNLSKEDYEAINKGTEERNRIIEEKLISTIYNPKDYFEEERLNLIANMIANGKLEIKIAFSNRNGRLGLYHEKVGIVHNSESDEIIAFSGSMNESENGFENNFETVDVFSSWHDMSRVNKKIKSFEQLWNDNESNAKVYEFPDAVKKSILRYNKGTVNMQIDEEEREKLHDEYVRRKQNKPENPDWLKLRDYQKSAIENWKNNDFQGIYDMATGTGKTLTGLASVMELYRNKRGRVAIIICAPYQHLVTQWCEDLESFNIKYIVGHSSSPQKNWKKTLERMVFDYNNKIEKYFCFITTNATFRTKFVQDLLNTICINKLLLVDEAHNFGSETLLKTLNDSYKYRLALSATLERHDDETGTEALKGFFGKKCIEYGLKEAIDEEMLTPYKYYPIPVYLQDDELEEYNKLTEKIIKCIKEDKNGKLKISAAGKMLLIKRARLVAGAKNKLSALGNIMSEYKDKNNILVYCGATVVDTSDSDEYSFTENELRQIKAVEQLLYYKLGMRISEFTSEESSVERNEIKRSFANQEIQALVAIKCLDEGVNIPSIENVFILASSTNPKEYIQRRGRVLRLYPGKDRAYIYDFVTLPRDLDLITITDDTNYDLGLVKRELTRIKDFASLAQNPIDSDILINKIENAYQIIIQEGDEGQYE